MGDSYDAAVIELRHEREIIDCVMPGGNRVEYTGLLAHAKENKKPVYIVDVIKKFPDVLIDDLKTLTGLYILYDGAYRVGNSDSVVSCLRGLAETGMGFVMAGEIFFAHDLYRALFAGDESVSAFSTKMMILNSKLFPVPIGEGRDAVNARKIEEYVAPELQERL